MNRDKFVRRAWGWLDFLALLFVLVAWVVLGRR